MKILLIGGTRFVGPALVDAARARGHDVTLFNRGLSAPDAYPDIESITGDRERDLDQLKKRHWDAVIDTCGYFPRQLKMSAGALRQAADHYTFISSISVYPVEGSPRRDESAPVLPLGDDAVEEITDQSYGPLKVGCEAALLKVYPNDALIIRAGLIVGPGDPTNRFTYWVRRAAKAGDAIAPPAEQPMQFIDARDLARFIVHAAEARVTGIYNVTGPANRLTFGEFLRRVKDALGSDARFAHASDAFLREHDVEMFMGLPLWLHRAAAESFMTIKIDKALSVGLAFRPLAETVRETWEWARCLPLDITKPADLAPALEKNLLEAWNLWQGDA
jgi:2'-hydroxyisoflavone reductase